MKKFLILMLLVGCFTLTGCSTNDGIQEEGKDLKNHIVCIDGIEYLRLASGHQGYMAPHLKADKFNNPKVIKCELK